MFCHNAVIRLGIARKLPYPGQDLALNLRPQTELRMQKKITTATEIAMLLYWLLAGALALELITIDPSLMYSDYQNPMVIAWNWSFFPIDVAFATIGLTARFCSMSGQLKFKLEVTSAVLMLCAGVMAVSYWTITGDFDVTWWSMNVWLIVLGAANMICVQPDTTETA